MELVSERLSTPIRSPSEKDSRTLSVSRATSGTTSLLGYRRAAFSPPTGALRRDSEENLLQETQNEATRESVNEEDSGWDTDLEIDEGKEEYDVTGRTTYVQACRDSNVVPVSFFLRNMQEPEVDIKHHGLGPMGAKAIAIALVSNTSVIKLNVCDTWMGPEGAGYIAEMLRENCYISDLDLSDNKLGVKGADSVYDIMLHNSNITRLTASGNVFDDKAARILAESVKANNRLKYLCLSHNEFGERGGQLLAPSIAANDTLDELDLSWNHLRNKGACAVALSLKENITLKILNLAWNGFGNDGALAMAEALKVNSSLLELDLTLPNRQSQPTTVLVRKSCIRPDDQPVANKLVTALAFIKPSPMPFPRNNRITAEGAVHISKGLTINTSLQVLRIGKNPMQSAGAYAIVNSMKNNPESAIVEIELSDILVNNDFVELCKEVQEMRGNIKITHGGSGGSPIKPKTRPAPMKILKNYIADNQLRLLDFFNTLDKDKSMSITVKEFADGLKETGIDMNYVELYKLIETLDKNKDGEINYSELVVGSIEQNIEDRKEKIKELAAESRKRRILSPEPIK